RSHPFIPDREACGLNERFRLYRYDPGQRFAPHYDGSYQRSNGERSRLTFMVYLNEGFVGGETAFYDHREDLRLRVTPRTGTALVFVHDQLHEGRPVIEGRK